VVGAPPSPPELANVPGGRPLVPLIRELAAALENSPWLDTLTTIETASMPVIKLRCKPNWGGAPEAAKSSTPERGGVESEAKDGERKGPAEEKRPEAEEGSEAGVSGGGDVSVRDSEAPAVAIDITIMGRRGQPIGKDRNQEGPRPKSQHNGASARQFVIERLRKLPGLAPLVSDFSCHFGLGSECPSYCGFGQVCLCQGSTLGAVHECSNDLGDAELGRVTTLRQSPDHEKGFNALWGSRLACPVYASRLANSPDYRQV
jgi:hypothetical protein